MTAKERIKKYDIALAGDAGRKALERIINGESGEQALRDAEAIWSAYANAHVD